MQTMPASAVPVWCGTRVTNQTAAFRTTFELDSFPEQPEILVAADSDFVVWVNDVEVARGQYPDYPHVKTFNRASLIGKAVKGKNTIAILAYHMGRNCSVGLDGVPYVCAAVTDGDKLIVATSPDWKCAAETGWQNGLETSRTGQVGLVSSFDSRVLPGWNRVGYDDSAWKNAVPAEADWTWRERPVPVCDISGFTLANQVKCGTFRHPADEQKTVALGMYNASYFYTSEMPASAGNDDGIFGIFDLGRESVGFLTFEIEAPDGTVVDFGYGEHLDDGIVRTYVGERNFADRYIAHAGLNRHELLFHRCGLRYIQINISNLNGKTAKIVRTGIRSWDYPRPRAASFVGDDLSVPPLREAAVRTLELCMHEHFEDCPWREQSMYSYDSRNQALYGYYVWGNYDFVRSAYQLIADSWQFGGEFHMMTLCAPCQFWISIPVFGFAWINAARDLYFYSGSRKLFDDNAAMVADMLDDALSKKDPVSGLCHTGTEPYRWNFYEWSPGLEGEFHKGCPEGEYHAPYNLYLIEALESASALFGGERGAKYHAAAQDLRRAVHQAFWDEAKQAYASKKNAQGFFPNYHDHTQYLALRNNVVPDEATREAVMKTLYAGTLNFATLSALPYLIDAAMPVGPEARKYAAKLIRETYGAMIRAGATSLWETQEGAPAFANAGSLCHGWSSLPLYYEGAEVLGVRPLEPGFRRFTVRPYADEWTHFADGEVPTPHGMIRIVWQKREDGLYLKVHAPEGTEFEVQSYPECPVASVERI